MPADPARLRPERKRPALGVRQAVVLVRVDVAFGVHPAAGQRRRPAHAHRLQLARRCPCAGQSVDIGIHSSHSGISGPAGW